MSSVMATRTILLSRCCFIFKSKKNIKNEKKLMIEKNSKKKLEKELLS